MTYKDFGLVNTKKMLLKGLKNQYAVPAFNFYNMETLQAILSAAKETKSPVILSISESALEYMGADLLMGMIRGKEFKAKNSVALHLDHGRSFKICKQAIDMGFSSVMIDASQNDIEENIKITKKIVDYAKKFDVTVEAELGVLSGIEDEHTASEQTIYTNPQDVMHFISKTGIDSLAIAIGTSHGAYKRKTKEEELRFDILKEIYKKLPQFPLVLHGASSVPENLVKTINKYGGNLDNARGIPQGQIIRAVSMNICKINVDTDLRLATTSAIREHLFKNPSNFDPRKYLKSAFDETKKVLIKEIKEIMKSDGHAKY